MTKDDLNKMSELKQTLIAQLITMTQIAQLTRETLPLAGLLHAVTGAALLNQEKELMEELMPTMERLAKEATDLLSDILKDKEFMKGKGTEAEDKPTSDDFFEKNEIIH